MPDEILDRRQGEVDDQYLTSRLKLDRKMGTFHDMALLAAHTSWACRRLSLGIAGGPCGHLPGHAEDLTLLISGEQAIDYCRYHGNHNLEVAKGLFLSWTASPSP